MSEIRIAFKAGRAIRREGTNFVDAQRTKGAVIIQNGEDGLLHFIWKNRVTNENEEDLILFPGDASFIKVPQSAWGRTFVLKFSSSNQRHFFWMQDADSSRDEEFVNNVNRLLADPESVPVWWSGPSTSAAPAASSSTLAAPAASSSSQPASALNLSADQLARLRSVLSSAGTTAAAAQQPEYLLSDILTPANLTPLFTSHPELVQTLFPHLPPDLPTPPSPETLQQIIQSPQFRSAVRSFDQALRTGMLGGLVRSLGLPEEAGTGIEPFLRAIQEQANKDGSGDSMETD
ncbi:Proteasomal ubiquitin receptor Rpn13/ADRM1 [Abortiporus biennis]